MRYSIPELIDKKQMSYNHAYGGTIPFPQDQWRNWYSKWITNDNGRRYYRYLRNDSNEFVGEIGLRSHLHL